MRILLVGDVVGRPGRRAVEKRLQQIKDEYGIDFCVLNCENAAAGFGITEALADDLLEAGADVLTSGNHIWSQKGTEALVEKEPRLLRPANFPPGVAGTGGRTFRADNGVTVGVLNLMGRVFMRELDCPFQIADKEIARLNRDGADLIVVDFHAEATSEKMAMGWYLDRRVAAVVGTHTHVMTADERILPGGTAYLTDLGMTGPVEDTIIGVHKQEVLDRFVKCTPERFEVPKRANSELCAVFVEYSLDTNRALTIKRIQEAVPA